MTKKRTTYSAALATRICEELAGGRSLRAICRDKGMPAQSSVFKWLTLHADFAEQYARAREAQADAMLEEILEIADDGRNDTYEDDDGNVRTDHDVIARSKLRVEARKWAMSKMAPKKYGDRLELEHGGEVKLTPTIVYKGKPE